MSSAAQPVIERRIRISGLLVILGLGIQMATLFWNHPLSFMLFLLVGCPLTVAGMILYLYSLASHGKDSSDP